MANARKIIRRIGLCAVIVVGILGAFLWSSPVGKRILPKSGWAESLSNLWPSSDSDDPPVLQYAKLFALGPVGFGGSYSQEELQFEAILALAPNKAKQTLERLYSSGNPQAMSYALLGMRKLDRKRFAELLVSARVSNLTVDTMSGCIPSKQKLSAIASDLDSGKYDRWLR